MAPAKRAAPAWTPAGTAPFAVRAVTPACTALVACRTEEEALSVIGFIASARSEGRMCLLPATAWSEALGDAAGHILIDPEGASACMVRDAPAPARALAALEALPPLPGAPGAPGGGERWPRPSCAGGAAAPSRAGGTPSASSGRGARGPSP